MFNIPSFPPSVIDGHAASDRLDNAGATQSPHGAAQHWPSRAPLVGMGPVGAILTRIEPQRLRTLQQRVADDLGRLIPHVPETAPHLRECLEGWRQRYEKKVDPGALNEHDALMLDGGRRILKRLLDDLDTLQPAERAALLDSHEARFRCDASSNSRSNFKFKSRVVGSTHGIVLTLAHLMVDTERVALSRAEGNPRWNERVARLSPWVGPPSAVTTRAVQTRLNDLGLGDPKSPTELRDRRPIAFDPKDAIHMNAHWKICLTANADPDPGADPDPEDEPLLTHLGNAEFAQALDRLLACCHSLGVVESRPLSAFADQWLGSLPTGEKDDPVARLQTLGVQAMRDIAKRLGRPETDSFGNLEDKRALLAELLDALPLSNDPAATLCHFVRYRVPTDPRLASEEHFDAVRRVAIDSGIRKAASLPREFVASPEINLRIRKQGGHLQQLLGVRAASGDPPPEDCGLFDASSASLAWLSNRICAAVNWRARTLNAKRLTAMAAKARAPSSRPAPTAPPPDCSLGGTNLSVATSSGAVKRSIQSSPSHHPLAPKARQARRSKP